VKQEAFGIAWSEPGSKFAYLKSLEDALTKPKNAEFMKMYASPAKSGAPFALFEVGCGEHYCREMITSLRSLAVQYTANGNWDAWCVVDEACNKLLDRELPLGDMICNKLPIQELLSVGSVNDLFHKCASARLWVPQVLTNLASYERLVYLDSDTMITDSIQPMLQIMKKQNAAAFSMVEGMDSTICAGCGWYNTKPSRRAVGAGVNGYNSGVLGINVHLWHQEGIVDKVLGILQEAKKGQVLLELGDQDILNLMAKRNSSLLQQLPCEFNMRSDFPCRGKFDYHTPVVIHGSRNIFHKKWKKLYEALIHQTHTMLYEWSNEQRFAMSLWEASGVNVSSLFED